MLIVAFPFMARRSVDETARAQEAVAVAHEPRDDSRMRRAGALPAPRARRLARSGRHQRGSALPTRDQHGNVGGAALSDRRVALIVERTAERAGNNPKTVGGHSLRAGFATTAAKKGKSLGATMRQKLHRCEKVARGYFRHAKLFDDNACSAPTTCAHGRQLDLPVGTRWFLALA